MHDLMDGFGSWRIEVVSCRIGGLRVAGRSSPSADVGIRGQKFTSRRS
jgi:hypothetical protein